MFASRGRGNFVKAFQIRMGALMAACVRDHDWRTPPPEISNGINFSRAHELPALAKFHGVGACLFQSLRHCGEPGEPILAELERSYHGAVRSQLRGLAGVGFLGDVLDELCSPWMIVKGPVLAQKIYSRADLRNYADVDVLVHPAAFGDTVVALERADCTVRDVNWLLLAGRMIGQLQIVTPQGMVVDLHWNLVNDARLRSYFAIPNRLLFERSRKITLAGRSVQTLDPVDTLLHLAFHGAMAGGNRLLWLKDIEQSVLNEAPPWQDVIERATLWRIGLTLATMLGRARHCLGLAVPDQVFHGVASSAWLFLNVAADRLSPVQHATGSRSLSRIIARSSRSDFRDSSQALVRRSWLGFRSGSKLRGLPPRSDSDATSSESLLYPAGGQQGRLAFLNAVAGWEEAG